MDAAAGRDAITKIQGENWRASLAGWWYSREDVDKKQGKVTPKARRIQAFKLAQERGGLTRAVSALISPPTALRDNRTLTSKRFQHIKRGQNNVQGLQQLVNRRNSRTLQMNC